MKICPANEKFLFVSFLVISIIVVFLSVYFSKGIYDIGDGIQHLLIAKYSWKHPQLFLDWWGKPVFTLLSSPFAQFDMTGMVIFQIICGAISSVFIFKTIKHLNIDFGPAVPFLIFFSPIYFNVINSGLTEILFATFLSATLWYLMIENYLTAAMIFSFTPFVRPEAYFLFPLFIFVLLAKKKLKFLPFVFTGFFVYSVIGYFFYFHDFFWYVRQNYRLGQNYSYKGDFFHYFDNYDLIWGKYLGFFLLAGLIKIFFDIIRNFIFKKSFEHIDIIKIFVTGSFFIMLGIHILMNWMPGINSNLGILRYLTITIPFAVIIELYGIVLLEKFVGFLGRKISRIVGLTILSVVIFSMLYQIYASNFFPFSPNNEQITIDYATPYLKKMNHQRKVYFLHPYIAYSLNIDPFDKETSSYLYNINQSSKKIEENAMIIWNSHFSPQEGNNPLKIFSENKHFQFLKQFEYFDDSQTFYIAVFQKKKNTNKLPLPNKYIISDCGLVQSLDYDSLNFDKTDISGEHLSDKIFFSSQNSIIIKDNIEFSPGISKSQDKLPVFAVGTSFYIYPTEPLKDVLLVIHVEDTTNGKTVDWKGVILPDTLTFHTWHQLNYIRKISQNINYRKNKIKIYFWNKGKKTFYIDDFLAKFYYCKNE